MLDKACPKALCLQQGNCEESMRYGHKEDWGQEEISGALDYDSQWAQFLALLLLGCGSEQLT